jgi:hypothetical protein
MIPFHPLDACDNPVNRVITHLLKLIHFRIGLAYSDQDFVTVVFYRTTISLDNLHCAATPFDTTRVAPYRTLLFFEAIQLLFTLSLNFGILLL